MNVGDKIVIELTPSGAYKITLPDGTAFIGGAASTIMALTASIFRREAHALDWEKECAG